MLGLPPQGSLGSPPEWFFTSQGPGGTFAALRPYLKACDRFALLDEKHIGFPA